MKAEIKIGFLEINGRRVTKQIVTLPLMISTQKMLSILCKNLRKYFKEKKIKTEIDFELTK